MKVLIADDDADLRALLGFALTQAGFTVHAVADGRAALSAFDHVAPDLLVLDINMPQVDGFEVCREIRRRSMLPILVLTARHDEEDLIAALEYGADDYVRKPFSTRALLARVRALARRAEPPPVRSLTAGTLRLEMEDRSLHIGDSVEIRLTPLETKTLELLIQAPGRTVTTDRLLMHLWGRTSGSERGTLKQLIYRLRMKLEQQAPGRELVQTTQGAGYRLLVE